MPSGHTEGFFSTYSFPVGNRENTPGQQELLGKVASAVSHGLDGISDFHLLLFLSTWCVCESF